MVEDYGEELDAEGVRMLNTLPKLTVTLENMRDNLLQVSRGGRLEMALAKVDLNEVLQQVIDQVELKLKEQAAATAQLLRDKDAEISEAKKA